MFNWRETGNNLMPPVTRYLSLVTTKVFAMKNIIKNKSEDFDLFQEFILEYLKMTKSNMSDIKR